VSTLLEQVRVLVESVILTPRVSGHRAGDADRESFPPDTFRGRGAVCRLSRHPRRIEFLGCDGSYNSWSRSRRGCALRPGAWLGAARLRLFFRRYGRWLLVSEEDFDRVLSRFNCHDRSVVFWARLMPGVRSLISIPAGVARMPVRRFLLFTALSTLVWNLALGSAGVLLGQNWEQVLTVIDRFESVLWLLLAALVVWWTTRRIVCARATARK